MFTKLKDPYLQAVCAMAVTCILNVIVTAHVDQHLINSRVTSFLGVLLGLIVVVESIHMRMLNPGESLSYSNS